MPKFHTYETVVTWTGNQGEGTSGYKTYSRRHEISSRNKPAIPASADLAFRGDTDRYNPEELLVASLAGCHMLWYLHLAADSGVVVVDYHDESVGFMQEDENGGGKFKKVTLRPVVTITRDSDLEAALSLHQPAHRKCYIANSVNFTVGVEPTIQRA
ncbi:MAG: OsmC family protein [Burkholderiales bacterium]